MMFAKIRKLINPFTSSIILFLAAGFQMAAFLLIARALGANDFGQYSAILTFIVPMAEFGGFGSGDHMIRRISRKPSLFQYLYYSCLFTTTLTGLAASILTVGVCRLFLPSYFPLPALVAVVLSEVVFLRLSGLVDQSFIALGKVSFANLVRLTSSVARFFYGAFLFLSHDFGLKFFSYGLLLISVLLAVFTNVLLIYICGRPKRSRHFPLYFTGPSFAFHQFGRVVGQSMDRMILAITLPSVQLGIYNAGARILQAMLIPLNSVVRDKYSGYFVAGKTGIQGSLSYARREVVPSLYKVMTVAALVSFGISVFLPYFLGTGYEKTIYVGLGMTCGGCLIAVQYVLGDILTGSNHQKVRMMATLFSVGLAAVEMFVLALWFGLSGAIAGFLLAQTTGVTVLFFFVQRELNPTASTIKVLENK